MASTHIVSISMVSDFFKTHNAQLKRGEKSYESGYVLSLQHDFSINPPLIKGTVSASMKQRTYAVEMFINNTNIHSMTCNCPRGKDVCHHMASFALYCHYNISLTDTICSWNRPKSTNEDVSSTKKFFPAKSYTSVKTPVTSVKLKQFKENLRKCHVVGFSWLLRPECSEIFASFVPEINAIIYSEEYIIAENKIEFFKEKSKLTSTNIVDIEKNTRGQARNENWLIAKKLRLTASKFGKVIDAFKRNRYPPSLFKDLIGSYKLEGVKAIQWGRENEEVALNIFKEKTKLDVLPSGLWLHECGYLGASPDGIIDDNAILEIKCPFKYRHLPAPLKDHLKDSKYIIYFDENDEVNINQTHLYYHQIQGQLYLTNRKLCYLIIWTPNDSEIFSVSLDPNWKDNINVLQNFYLTDFISYLLK